MLSVFEMAEIVATIGHEFQRDPWTGKITVSSWGGVPERVRTGLLERWGDLEAILAELEPSRQHPVEVAQRLVTK
jgi:hypothetical protein